MATRALVVSTVAGEHETAERMGSASYSYYYVYRAFAPLLRRWGSVVETVRPADALDDVLRRIDAQEVVHLGFLPLDAFHSTARAPNVAFPFWDFPDLPDYPLGGDPHNDWTTIANSLDLILTSSDFTRDAFVRAGVHTPIRLVRVPVRAEVLALPLFQPDQRVVMECGGHAAAVSAPAWPAQSTSSAKALYQRYVRPRLSRRAVDALSAAAHAWRDGGAVDCPAIDHFELSGVVYTAVFNPFDQRKNWPDLLTAYLIALRDCDDATLVLKLAVPPDRAAAGINKVLAFHRRLGITHRCKLLFVSAYLTDAQMLELARGTTYYLNASRCEGACLPLQDFLAAARPAIAPRHTAIADYFGDDAGFVVESHPEPASWPQDPDGRCTTTWHRLVWTSLRDRIRESYDVARGDRPRYEALAAGARARMASMAGSEPVWTQLSAALDSIHAV